MQLREIKSLVDSTSDAAFAVDGNSLIVAWNQAAEKLFGVVTREALGKACGSILHCTSATPPSIIMCSTSCVSWTLTRGSKPYAGPNTQGCCDFLQTSRMPTGESVSQQRSE